MAMETNLNPAEWFALRCESAGQGWWPGQNCLSQLLADSVYLSVVRFGQSGYRSLPPVFIIDFDNRSYRQRRQLSLLVL